MPTVGTIALTEYSDSSDRRVWALDSHTSKEPRLVIQKRRTTGSGENAKMVTEISVVYGTLDADGNPLQSKINLTLTATHPIAGEIADLQSAVDTFQALIGAVEIDAAVEKQMYLG